MIHEHIAPVWKHVYTAAILLVYCMMIPPCNAPCIIIYNEQGDIYKDQSYVYDHRIVDTITEHIHGLCYPLPPLIPHRYQPHTTSQANEIHNILEEIRTCIHERRYTDIDTLAYTIKDDNFDYQSGTGMLIMRLHDHPFVIKMFITTHDKLTYPHGFEPYFFMRMNGGITRHIAGLTRVTTNNMLQSFLHTHQDTYPRFTTPRVWSWVPSDTLWLTVHLSTETAITYAQLPAEYVLINDAIEYEPGIYAPQERVFQLFQDTNNLFDPHSGNCVIDANTDEYVILDTESFTTMTGFTEPLYTASYLRWYLNLIYTCAKHILFPHLTRIDASSRHAQYTRAYTPNQHCTCAAVQSSHTHA